MALRRHQLEEMLKGSGTIPLSMTVFPRLGCPNFTDPTHQPTPTSGASHSLFFPDEAIWTGHPRYSTLTRNIRERRGSKVAMNIPIFTDEKTPKPFIEEFPTDVEGKGSKDALPDHIYMDCMGFGMGCCCLQVTFQACCVDEARHLYDQLSVIAPIITALSSASPVFRGYLADWDCRWSVIEGSVDDRTEEERGLKPLDTDKFVIPKSRYSPVSYYLSSDAYNDVDYPVDKELYEEMREADIDHLLAQHMAHLFIRDPVSLFEEKLEQDLETETDHFENIQSTNWQSMRFKPPPPDSTIGWRVEFRPMELQLTDFENAAFAVFVVLLTRTILSFGLNFLIPISKSTENMLTAQKRDAATKGLFYFRKTVTPPESDTEDETDGPCQDTCCHDDEYCLMDANMIINGKVGQCFHPGPPYSQCLYTHTYTVRFSSKSHSHGVRIHTF
jgi:glutamate--cysteine ligase catalytic subunit